MISISVEKCSSCHAVKRHPTHLRTPTVHLIRRAAIRTAWAKILAHVTFLVRWLACGALSLVSAGVMTCSFRGHQFFKLSTTKNDYEPKHSLIRNCR